MEEREDARGVVAEAVLEIEVFVLLGAPPAFGSAGRLGSGILCGAFFDDAIVSGDEGDFFGVSASCSAMRAAARRHGNVFLKLCA